MADELPSMDISGVPDLVRLTEEARRANEPRLLRRGSETLAIIVPAGRLVKRRRRRVRTAADLVAFEASFGSWKDVDTEALNTSIGHVGSARRLSIAGLAAITRHSPASRVTVKFSSWRLLSINPILP